MSYPKLERPPTHTKKQEVVTQMVLAWRKKLEQHEQLIIDDNMQELEEVLMSDDADAIVDFLKKSNFNETFLSKLKNFLQARKRILESIETDEELEELMNDIQHEPFKQMRATDELKIYGAGAVGDMARIRYSARRSKWNKKLAKEGLQAAQESEKTLVESSKHMVRRLEDQIKSPGKTVWQKNRLRGYLKELKKADQIVGSTQTLHAWKGLVDQNILPLNILKTTRLSSKQLTTLTRLQSDHKLLGELIGKSDKEIKNLLKARGYKLPSSVTKHLSKAQDITQLSGIVKVFSSVKKLNGLIRFAKALKAVPLMDGVVGGVMTYNYMHGEKNERNTAQYAWGMSMVAAQTIAFVMATGPVGWATVGGLVALDVAVSHAMDVGYFDIKDFYNQTESDFLMHDIGTLKISLVQTLSGAGFDPSDRSINERTFEIVSALKGENVDKEKPAHDIVSTLAYKTSQKHLSDTEAYLSATDKDRVRMINNQTDLRMEYLDRYLPGGSHNKEFLDAIHNNHAMGYIDQLLKESTLYLTMQQDDTSYDSLASYSEAQLDDLHSKNPQLFESMENLVSKHPLQAAEFFARMESFTKAYYDNHPKEVAYTLGRAYTQEDTQSYYDTSDRESELFSPWAAIPILEYIQDYSTLKHHTSDIPQISYIDNMNYQSSELTLQHILKQGRLQIMNHTRDETSAISELRNTNIRGSFDTKQSVETLEYSGDIRQDIIYRMAKEFSGYTGPNVLTSVTGESLMHYLSDATPGNDNMKGIYYNTSKEQRVINNDRAKDVPLDFSDIDTKTTKELLTDRFQETPYWMRVSTWMLGPVGQAANALDLLPKTQIKDIIDTSTETPDDNLNKEFFNTMQTIISEEKLHHSESNKTRVRNDIVDYIQTHAQEGYVILPTHLVEQAGQSGLGTMGNWFFKWSGDHIVALASDRHVADALDLPDLQKSYTSLSDDDGTIKPYDEYKQDARPIALDDHAETMTEKVEDITHRIESTASAMQWSNRGKVSYNPTSQTLESRGVQTTILPQEDGSWLLQDDENTITTSSLDEAVNLAIVYHYFRTKFLSTHRGRKVFYERRPRDTGRAVYVDDSERYTLDTRILSTSFIQTYLQKSFSNNKRNETMKFLLYHQKDDIEEQEKE